MAARIQTSGIIWDRVAPSFMIARVAEIMCVSGKSCATFFTQVAAPSKENHEPDNSIIGHVMTFNMPPANSSLAVLEAINMPIVIKLIAPNVLTSNSAHKRYSG